MIKSFKQWPLTLYQSRYGPEIFAKRIHAPITDITKCPLIAMHTRAQSIMLDKK